MSVSPLEILVEAGILAPSGDNTQPWRFEIDESQRSVTVTVDPTRDPSPMNAGQCMARIAVGCALENMRQTAEFNEWPYEVTIADDYVRITIEPNGDQAPKISEVIRNRTSNRRVYQGEPIDAETIARLQAACPTDGPTQIHWITEASQREKLCELIGRADAILLSAEGPRKAFLEKVRFDQPPTAVVDEGLSLGSLELTAPQQMAMRLMPRVPNWLLTVAGGKTIFRSAALKLAQSASGFCLVSAANSGARADYEIGKALEQAWLALTAQRLACQPAMSLLVLHNINENGADEQKQSIHLSAMEELLAEFSAFAKTFSNQTPRALLRFGTSPPPTSRVGRRQIANPANQPDHY